MRCWRGTGMAVELGHSPDGRVAVERGQGTGVRTTGVRTAAEREHGRRVQVGAETPSVGLTLAMRVTGGWRVAVRRGAAVAR